VVKATFDALANLRDAFTIAKTRGITMDQVFNG
jgi:small subunit ribosomal protein S5